ncbi:hypothetical protein G647_00332 [Cladophialophora carrionii CBS 160.54]|uniref:Uncharacterized protein n=1 Tax=Cladophialophora carrionii CBS 160.54 TaxID=1279043 RepID=V9DNL2_9EURO|nr:uncharacterized protein G647_00332 [Cladophialophora carrionii CBS 160.54]ETI27883.1 hypothetical protein G647_00332 [Cladophialophora carrionii CBS 160.54]
MGLLVPEIVLFTAWEQLSRARGLVRFLNEELTRQQSAGKLKDKAPRKFTLKYGFFVCKGGLRMPAPEFAGSTPHVPLSPSAIKLLAQNGRFLQIEDSTIKDHGKSDALAKTLIRLQILWLIIECVARKVHGLPLSTLEIHTFVRVVCSLAVYILWLQISMAQPLIKLFSGWKTASSGLGPRQYYKPLDIGESTIAALSEDDHDLMSLLEVSTRFRSWSIRFFLPDHNTTFRLSTTPTCEVWGDVDVDSLPSARFSKPLKTHRGRARPSNLEHGISSKTWKPDHYPSVKDLEWQFDRPASSEVAVVMRYNAKTEGQHRFKYYKVPVDEAHSLNQATLGRALLALQRHPDLAKSIWHWDCNSAVA